ncbi:Replication factor-A carboxy-terminal domain protein [Arachis hypogaea]|nr:Replication factor-A carboxy-terminal domain protein [Arachis hypogaea]
MVHNPLFPGNVFRFVPNDLILNHTNAQSHLIDVIGLFTGKGDIIQFTKNGKKCNYIVLELDDMKAANITKFNLFKDAMGISNTNHNSILYINVDFQEVKDFRKSVIMAAVPHANQLSQIATEPAYSMEDDLINNSIYKPISELKASIDKLLWEAKDSYYCAKCATYPTTHTPRYSINMKVADDIDTAAFLLYDKEATKFLGISASDLRLAHLTRPNLAMEHSELLSLQTASTDTSKGTSSPSVETLVDNSNDAFSTPKRNIISGGWSKQLIDLYPDSANGSSLKCRNLEDGILRVDKVYQD